MHTAGTLPATRASWKINNINKYNNFRNNGDREMEFGSFDGGKNDE